MGFLTVAVKSCETGSERDIADASFINFLQVGYYSWWLIGLSSGVSCSSGWSASWTIFFDSWTRLRVMRLTGSSGTGVIAGSLAMGPVLSLSFLGVTYYYLCDSIWLIWSRLKASWTWFSSASYLWRGLSLPFPLLELRSYRVSTLLQLFEAIYYYI